MLQNHETPTRKSAAAAANDLADSAAHTADHALSSTKHAVDRAASSVESTLDDLRDTVPSAITRAAARAEDLTRRGIEKARDTTLAMREQAGHASDRTVGYIREEPVKAVMVAAAAGAFAAVLVGWLSRSRSDRY